MNKEVKSAARVLDVLELLSSRSEPTRLNDLVTALSLPKSSAHGLLMTLVSRGYVAKDSADRYSIVEDFRQGFGWVGGFESFLISIAKPIVEEIRDKLNETVFICVRTDQQDARLICKAVSRHPIRYDSSDLDTLPGYGTAMGRVLLAWQPKEVIDEYFARTRLEQFTETTPTTETELREILAEIRRVGHATIVDQFATGGAGIAAPIRNAAGNVVAVMDIATVSIRYEQRRDEMLKAVLAGAEMISARLGYRSGSELPHTTQNNSQGEDK